MGFNSYHINEKGQKVGGFARIWKVEDKGKYSIVELSTSKKDQNSGKWETDFQHKFVRFIGPAHTMAQGITEPTSIRIKSCDVTKIWSQEKQQEYTNYIVFEFELPEANKSPAKKTAPAKNPMEEDFMKIPDGDDEELPF